MAARLLRIGRFHDDIAAQIGDLAGKVRVAAVVVFQGVIEGQNRSLDLLDDPLFGLAAVAAIRPGCHPVRGRQNDEISGTPTGHRLGQRKGCVSFVGRRC